MAPTSAPTPARAGTIQAPPPAPPARHTRGRAWLAAVALFATAFGVAEWSDRPPPPAPADAPATSFSEARARPVLEQLAGSIGPRVIGTAGRDSAAAYLVSTLRGIPGVEVRVQEWTGSRPSLWRPGTVELYHARNVLARIPGDSASAVLVSAHYDSPPESVGAGDAALAVAASVEAARALAADPRPRHSVLFNFNDGEEAGLLGSAAFLDDPWARDVRAFVNLESAGPGGKAILFQAGPGNGWLTEAYARSVPRPYGSVLAQDIFQSGVIPSDTDFRIYRDDGGLRGLDVALYQDGWAYHTGRDRVERVQPGSLQHMGENTLALVRGLAGGELPGDVGGAPAVYYDVLGRGMLAYSAGTAGVLAGVALLLALGALALALVRTPLTVRGVLAGFGVAVGAVAVGLLCALAVSLLLALLGRPHRWFAAPWLGWAAFSAFALAGFLGVHALWARWRRRRGRTDVTELDALAGAVLFWMPLLALMTAAGIGSAYLVLWWTLAAAAMLVLRVLLPRRQGVALAAAWLLPALLTAQVGLILLKLFAPVAGRFPAGIPFDPVIALLVALPVLWMAVPGAAALHRAGGFGRAALAAAAAGVVGVAALSAASPYTSERPKRLAVQQQVTDTSSRVMVSGMDWTDASLALRGVEGPAFRRDARGGAAYVRPAERPALPPLPLRVEPQGAAEDGTRTVRLHLDRGAYHVASVRIPADRLAGWSLSDSLPRLEGGADRYTIRAYPPPAGGWEVMLRLRGPEPVEAEVVEVHHGAGRTPAVDAVVRDLPGWADAHASVARTGRITL